jgi:hypothetical protein
MKLVQQAGGPDMLHAIRGSQAWPEAWIERVTLAGLAELRATRFSSHAD